MATFVSTVPCVRFRRVCLRRFENAATLQRLPVSTVTRMLESLNAAGVQAPGTLRDMLWLIPAEKLQVRTRTFWCMQACAYMVFEKQEAEARGPQRCTNQCRAIS